MDVNVANKLVLLVDDEVAWLKGMQAWLRDNEAGFAVLSASDGIHALEMIDRHQPDLVVSDVRLPGMDGLELLLTCRRKYPTMRFIIMSAFGTPDLERRFLQGGAVRFLHKPVDLPLMERTICEVLDQGSGESQAGFLHGISVPGFAQLLNLERQTGTLQLKRADGCLGKLVFLDGELVDAESGETKGGAAARELFAWEGVEMSLVRSVVSTNRTVEENLGFLIMEAMRIQDEKKPR